MQAVAQGDYSRQHQKEIDDIENEKKMENEDPTALKQSRDWDEWKDGMLLADVLSILQIGDLYSENCHC